MYDDDRNNNNCFVNNIESDGHYSSNPEQKRSWQDRVCAERNALDINIAKLAVFLKDDAKFNRLNSRQRDLLLIQFQVMKTLDLILSLRLLVETDA